MTGTTFLMEIERNKNLAKTKTTKVKERLVKESAL